MLSEEIKKSASTLLGLIDHLETKGATPNNSTRAAMGLILSSLKDLAPGLWPQEAQVRSPVPDKVIFNLKAPYSNDVSALTFHSRADGIYFEGVRIEHTKLTAESVQKLVLDKLTAYYANVTEVTG